MSEKEIIDGNKLIAKFMGYVSPKYEVSVIKDIHGKFIKQGDIINADGYDSDLKSDEPYLHCVEYDKSTGLFGSNIYGDFDLLHTYKKIEVVGHIEDFRNTDWSGNVGAALVDEDECLNYNTSWNDLMPVVEKIAEDYDVTISWYDKDCACFIYSTSIEHEEITSHGNFTPSIINIWKSIVKFIKFYTTIK